MHQRLDYLSVAVRQDDGVILSEGGTFLAAFYGQWPVEIAASHQSGSGIKATILRDRTLSTSSDKHITLFLAKSRPDRVWYVAFRTREKDLLATIENQGYRVHKALETRMGRLYLAVRLSRGDPPSTVGSVNPSLRLVPTENLIRTVRVTDRADVGPANDGNVSIADVHSVNADEWLASFGRSSGRRAACTVFRRRPSMAVVRPRDDGSCGAGRPRAASP